MKEVSKNYQFFLKSIWGEPYASGQGSDEYSSMIESLRNFLNQVAGTKPNPETLRRLSQTLQSWTEELSSYSVDESEQLFGRIKQVAGGAQTMFPLFVACEGDKDSVRGTVVFGRYFLGVNGAAHGGAVSLLFDQVMGRLKSDPSRPMARTAYLHVDYRSITPIDKPLDVVARIVSKDGRKILVTAQIMDGRTVCAEAEGLFLTLRPGQP